MFAACAGSLLFSATTAKSVLARILWEVTSSASSHPLVERKTLASLADLMAGLRDFIVVWTWSRVWFGGRGFEPFLCPRLIKGVLVFVFRGYRGVGERGNREVFTSMAF